MALLLRVVGTAAARQTPSLLRQSTLTVSRRSTITTKAYDEMGRFWSRNRSLNRPLSPFLTVYKPHLAMMTSLAHRLTGIAMQSAITGISIILLVVPGDFKHNLELLKSFKLGPAIIIAIKYIFALPVTYHFLNGIRHLAWDAGVGFKLATLYKSAYFAMSLTFLVSTYFVFMLKPKPFDAGKN